MNTAEILASSLVTGAFSDCASASRALESTVARGYRAADLSILVSDEARRHAFEGDASRPENGTAKVPRTGRALASSAAAITARLALIGRPALLPGLRILVAGPMTDALNGDDPVIGGLVDLGFPDPRAPHAEEHLRLGRVVLVLQARSPMDAQEIEVNWREWAIEVLA